MLKSEPNPYVIRTLRVRGRTAWFQVKSQKKPVRYDCGRSACRSCEHRPNITTGGTDLSTEKLIFGSLVWNMYKQQRAGVVDVRTGKNACGVIAGSLDLAPPEVNCSLRPWLSCRRSGCPLSCCRNILLAHPVYFTQPWAGTHFASGEGRRRWYAIHYLNAPTYD